MKFPQTIQRPLVSRLLIITFTLFLFPVFTASLARSASFRNYRRNYRTLAASSSSIGFGSIQVGSGQTQYQTLTNRGHSTVTISQAAVTGAGFSLSGLSLPLNLDRGESVTFSVLFNPKAGGDAGGAITVVSNASNPNLAIALSGTGVVSGHLTPSAGTLNFGSVTVGTSKTLPVTLTASGSSVVITAATSTSSEFLLTGLSLPKTIPAGGSASVSLVFTPKSSGTASANISLASNAANSPVVETLTGSGAGAASHSVSLRWNAGTSAVAGYNVYRSSTAGGPYAKINPVVAAGTNYVDSSVQGGKTYYYVSTAVGTGGIESKYSGQLQVAIPTP